MTRKLPNLLLCFLFIAVNGASAEPCLNDKGLIWIEVKIGESPESLSFLLDSGAEESVIDQRAAKKLGLKFASRETVQKVTGKATAYRTEDVALKFAGATLRKPLLALSLRAASRSCRRKIDGLLGVRTSSPEGSCRLTMARMRFVYSRHHHAWRLRFPFK